MARILNVALAKAKTFSATGSAYNLEDSDDGHPQRHRRDMTHIGAAAHTMHI